MPATINKDMTIAQFLEAMPGAAEVLFDEGMSCMVCGIAAKETIEEAARAHGLDPEAFVQHLSELVEQRRAAKESQA